jgi:ABC-type multidrug transport system fused ATPase/permease subunit
VFRNFNGYWKTKELTSPSLHNINVQIKPRELIGVTGKVGSGKSGLLGVILEEIPYYSGYFGKRGSVAYVEQEPIIFSATIKENVLFGSNY